MEFSTESQSHVQVCLCELIGQWRAFACFSASTSRPGFVLVPAALTRRCCHVLCCCCCFRHMTRGVSAMTTRSWKCLRMSTFMRRYVLGCACCLFLPSLSLLRFRGAELLCESASSSHGCHHTFTTGTHTSLWNRFHPAVSLWRDGKNTLGRSFSLACCFCLHNQ